MSQFKRLSKIFLIVAVIIGYNIFPAYESYHNHDKGGDELLALAIVGFVLYVASAITLKLVSESQKDPIIPIAIAVKSFVAIFYTIKICFNIAALSHGADGLGYVYTINIFSAFIVLAMQIPVIAVLRILQAKIKAEELNTVLIQGSISDRIV